MGANAKPREVGFSVNQYDRDGDKFDDCILIHIGQTTILRFGSFAEYEMFINQLQGMKEEIKANL